MIPEVVALPLRSYQSLPQSLIFATIHPRVLPRSLKQGLWNTLFGFYGTKTVHFAGLRSSLKTLYVLGLSSRGGGSQAIRTE